MTGSGQSVAIGSDEWRRSWDRDIEEFLGPIRVEVGYPSDPDAWPSGRDPDGLTYEYIGALENTIVAERRLRRAGLLR